MLVRLEQTSLTRVLVMCLSLFLHSAARSPSTSTCYRFPTGRITCGALKTRGEAAWAGAPRARQGCALRLRFGGESGPCGVQPPLGLGLRAHHLCLRPFTETRGIMRCSPLYNTVCMYNCAPSYAFDPAQGHAERLDHLCGRHSRLPAHTLGKRGRHSVVPLCRLHRNSQRSVLSAPFVCLIDTGGMPGGRHLPGCKAHCSASR